MLFRPAPVLFFVLCSAAHCSSSRSLSSCRSFDGCCCFCHSMYATTTAAISQALLLSISKLYIYVVTIFSHTIYHTYNIYNISNNNDNTRVVMKRWSRVVFFGRPRQRQETARETTPASVLGRPSPLSCSVASPEYLYARAMRDASPPPCACHASTLVILKRRHAWSTQGPVHL